MIKTQYIAFVLSIALFSCTSNTEKKAYLPQSGGTLNTLTIVTDSAAWEGDLGDAARAVFAAPVYGLTMEEPLFTLTQMTATAFHEYVKKSRTFVALKTGEQSGIKTVKNLYAKPQTGIIITAKNTEELKKILFKNANELRAKITAAELSYKIQTIKNNPLKTAPITEKFGIDLSVLFSYRITSTMSPTFMWLRKNIKNGTANLLIYELPYGRIKKDSTILQQIISVRDSIGKTHIPGPVKNSYMQTEPKFTPQIASTTINDKTALETRGIWDVKNDFMAGTFVNYCIDDPKNNRHLVIEGFVYAPQAQKRDYMFELEAIAKSVVID